MAEENKKLAPWQDKLQVVQKKWLELSGNDIALVNKELGYATQLIQSSTELQKCNPMSIYNACMNLARTGITLNPILKLAYLIPRNGKAVLEFDYKGLVKILKDAGALKDIRASIVYADEEFEEGENQLIPHRHVKKHAKTEQEHKNREVIGVYCVAVLNDNTVIYTELMPYWEVKKAENVSQSKDSQYSPWKNWRESMIKKTKIKADFKLFITDQKSEAINTVLEVEEINNGLSPEYKLSGKKPKSKLDNLFQDNTEDISFDEIPEEPKDKKQEQVVPEDDMYKVETELYGLPGKRKSVQIKVLVGLFSQVPEIEVIKGYDKAGISPYDSLESFIHSASVEELVLVKQALKL